MSNWLALTLALFVYTDGDLPIATHLHAPARGAQPFSAGEEISVLPTVVAAGDDQQSQSAPQSKGATLSDGSKLELIRYVSGEFAKALKPLPAGKEGFLVYVGQPISEEQLRRAVANHGAAVNTGDSVQITKLTFRPHAIAVDVNGGGRGKRNWLDHIQIGMAGPMPTSTTTTSDPNQQEGGPPGIQPGMGSTIFLEFDKTIPDLSPDDLKKLLTPLLDFTKQRSASVHWVDTLPPAVKKAIQDRRPAIGMDRDEVVAAIGKPDHKVRERDSDGNETEDWIYGQPPSKTVFVRFLGDHVTSIKQYPQ